jgi:hypothetical protein
MTRCEDCKVNYYVDCSKCYVRYNNLLDLLDVMEERVNPATKLQSVTFSEDIDNKDKTMDFSIVSYNYSDLAKNKEFPKF